MSVAWVDAAIAARITPVQLAALEAYGAWTKTRITSGVQAAEILNWLSTALSHSAEPRALFERFVSHGWATEVTLDQVIELQALLTEALRCYAPKITYHDLCTASIMLIEGVSQLARASAAPEASVSRDGSCIVYKKNGTVVYIPITAPLAKAVFFAVPEFEQAMFVAQQYIHRALAEEDRDAAHQWLRKALETLQSISLVGQQTLFEQQSV